MLSAKLQKLGHSQAQFYWFEMSPSQAMLVKKCSSGVAWILSFVFQNKTSCFWFLLCHSWSDKHSEITHTRFLILAKIKSGLFFKIVFIIFIDQCTIISGNITHFILYSVLHLYVFVLLFFKGPIENFKTSPQRNLIAEETEILGTNVVSDGV